LRSKRLSPWVHSLSSSSPPLSGRTVNFAAVCVHPPARASFPCGMAGFSALFHVPFFFVFYGLLQKLDLFLCSNGSAAVLGSAIARPRRGLLGVSFDGDLLFCVDQSPGFRFAEGFAHRIRLSLARLRRSFFVSPLRDIHRCLWRPAMVLSLFGVCSFFFFMISKSTLPRFPDRLFPL